MDAITTMGVQLFGVFTQLVSSLSAGMDACIGTNVLSSLVGSMGAPALAALVLLGCVFGD